MSTLKTTNLQHASAASPAIVLAADGTATAQLSSINGGPLAGARNRIINGDMRIDQRNAGASVTPGAGGIYTLDRWVLASSAGSKFSVQQNAGSVTPPPGFSKYLGLTVVSSVSVGSGDYWAIGQNIEGFNVDSLAFGTASAQSVTVSFWVRSSLTGTFGGTLRNGASNRSYPFTYSIAASNTWEYKTITIAGDTTGTWSSDNSTGLTLWLGLGVGSSNSGTAGSWTGSGLLSATGATSVVGTNGATFYITGVQLEAGSVATPFERRSYGQELALCQRYFNRITQGAAGSAVSSTTCHLSFAAGVPMRALPNYSLSAAARLDFPFVANYTQSSANIADSFSSQNCGYNFSLGNFTGLTANSRLVLRDDGGAISLSAEL